MIERRALLALGALAIAVPTSAQEKKVSYSSPISAVKAILDPKIKEEQKPYSKSLRVLLDARNNSRRARALQAGESFTPLDSAEDLQFLSKFIENAELDGVISFSFEMRPNQAAMVMVLVKDSKGNRDGQIHFDLSFEGEGYVIDDCLIFLSAAHTDPMYGFRLSKMLANAAKGL